jgi:hypothetical protein
LKGLQIPYCDQLIVTERFGYLETPPQLLTLTERFGTIGLCRRGTPIDIEPVLRLIKLGTGRDITMVTKPNIVAITAIVAALATPSVALSAKAKQPTWDTCYTLAVERGSAPGRGGSEGNKGGGMGHYARFMDECFAGKIPLGPSASAR